MWHLFIRSAALQHEILIHDPEQRQLPLAFLVACLLSCTLYGKKINEDTKLTEMSASFMQRTFTFGNSQFWKSGNLIGQHGLDK